MLYYDDAPCVWWWTDGDIGSGSLVGYCYYCCSLFSPLPFSPLGFCELRREAQQTHTAKAG